MKNHESYRREMAEKWLKEYYREDEFKEPAIILTVCMVGCGLLALIAIVIKIIGG